VRLATRLLVIVLLAAATAAVGGRRPAPPGHHGHPLGLDPAQFTTRIDHPFWPMTPGSRWVYRETDGHGGERRVEVTVTGRTKRVLGIEARVVRDVVVEGGQVRAATDDWFAQDRQGNLWQLGEVEHGARPTLVLPADPGPGTIYRQYHAATQVLSSARKASVPYGFFDHLIITRESTDLEPAVEHEFYARGVGPVLAITVSGGSGREELLHFEPARTADTGLG
jgi:hypothetical protein